MPTGGFFPGLSVDKDPLESNDLTAQVDVGQVITLKDGTRLQYVKNADTVSIAAGDFVYSDADGTVKKAGASQANKALAGVGYSTSIAAGRYGWIRLNGTVGGQAALTAGGPVKVDGTGQAATNVVAATDAVIGHAISATAFELLGDGA